MDRHTHIRGKQVKNRSITKADLDATGETAGDVLTVQADGSLAYSTPSGLGDMTKAVYDINTDNIVDKAETIDDGAGNSATAADLKDAVTKKHTQNSDTDLDATFEATFVKKVDNVNVLADITSTGANIEDAVTKKHTRSHAIDSSSDHSSSIVENNIVTADANGLPKDSGKDLSIDGTLVDNSDNSVPTEKAVKTYVDTELAGISSDSISDADGDTKIQVEESADEDIIRFDVAGTQEVQMDANGLKLKSGADVNEFSIDGLLAGNSDDAIPTEKAVKTYSDVIDDKAVKNQDNIMINAFRIAVNGSLTQFNMLDGIVDYYFDETGIDTVNSLNESYDSAGDYYSPSSTAGLSVSPFAHYKCNDNAASTVVTDNGTGSNNGVGNVNTSNYSVSGKINQGFEFNGTTEYINLDALCGDIKTDTTGSISVWINLASTSYYDTVFSISDDDGNAFGNLIFYSNSNRIAFEYGNTIGTTQWRAQGDTVFASDGSTWYHVVVVQDGTEAKIYVNSVEETLSWLKDVDRTKWFSNDSANLDIARLGCTNYAGVDETWFFHGKIDDFRYYQNKALTQAEIDLIYNSGTGTEDDQPTGATNNMTLISDTFTAESAPDTARAIILEEDVDAISLNSDLKIYASRDSGANWVQGTLSDEGDYDASKRILVADFTLAGSGVNMEYKLVSANAKDFKIHASSLNWA